MKPLAAAWGLVVLGALINLSTLLGWLSDVPRLTDWSATWATSKPTTAFAGVGLALVAGGIVSRARPAQVISFGVAICLGALWMAWLRDSIGVSLGLDHLIAQEGVGAIETVRPGQPAHCTMVAFLLASVGSVIHLVGHRRTARWFFALTGASGFVVLLVGYGCGVEFARCWWPSASSAMAVPTALQFACLAGALLLAGPSRIDKLLEDDSP